MLATDWSLLPTDIDNLALFLVLGSASALIFSMAKAGFGGGIGILAVPVMVYACGGNAKLAAGIMLPLLIAADYVAVVVWRRRWDWKAARRLIPGAILGIGVAWGALYALALYGRETQQQLVEHVMALMVGLIGLGFVGLRLVQWLRKRPLVFEPMLAKTLAVGAVAGLTSTFAHAAGPIVAMYFLSMGFTRGRYVASVAVTFWMVNQLKVPAYLHLGMIRGDTIGALVVLLPAIVTGAVLGVVLHKRLGDRSFAGAVYGLLALAGGGLVYKAIVALAG